MGAGSDDNSLSQGERSDLRGQFEKMFAAKIVQHEAELTVGMATCAARKQEVPAFESRIAATRPIVA